MGRLPRFCIKLYYFLLNCACIVWLAVILLKVKEVTAPFDTPSTVTLETVYRLLGVIVYVLLEPLVTETAPEEEIVPPAPAEAVIV